MPMSKTMMDVLRMFGLPDSQHSELQKAYDLGAAVYGFDKWRAKIQKARDLGLVSGGELTAHGREVLHQGGR